MNNQNQIIHMKKGVLSLFMLAATVMLKAQNPYPILPIDSVQFVNQVKLSNPTANTLPDYVDPTFKDTIYRDTVRFDGIVITNPRIYGLSATSRKAAYIQRKGGGPWSGMLVMCDPAGITPTITLPNLITETKFYDNFVVGFPVRVTGVIRAFQGETQVNLIRDNVAFTNSVEQLSLTPDTLVYTEIQARDLMTGNPNTGWVQQKQTAEQWEGTLVRIRNVSVYNNVVGIGGNMNRSAWSVIDDFGNVLDVRDFSAYFRRDDNEDTVPKITNTFFPPPIGTRLEYIQGVVTEYSVNNIQRYGIVPIYPSDFKVCTSCPPIVKYISRSPQIAKATDTLTIVVEITTGDTTLRSQSLYFRSPSNPNQIDSVPMTAVAGFPNYYAGKVNPTGVEGFFTYWVRAEDRKDRQTFFPDPLTLGRSLYITNDGVNSIATLQRSNTNSLSTIWDGDSLLNISVPGIVTSAGSFGSLITVQAGTGPNSAIFVQRGPNDSATNWQVGDSVVITRATVRENFNVTTLRSVLGNVVSSGNALPAFAMNLPIDSFGLNRVAYARPYEGVLVKWDSVEVANTNPDAPGQFGEFSFAKTAGAANALRVDDLNNQLANLNRTLKVGMKMSFIQGPMYFAFGNFKLIPRGLADLDLSAIDTISPEITLKGNNPDTVEIGSGAYADSGAVAIDDKDGDISNAIVVTGTVNTTALGTYVLQYKVSDSWGNSDSVERIVVVKDTASVGLGDNELTYALVQVYPNPTSNAFTISAQFVKTQPVTIVLTDLLGKELASRTVAGTQFTETFDTTNLGEGVYFCTLRNQAGMRTVKVMVQH
jgi:hypothetical protein